MTEDVVIRDRDSAVEAVGWGEKVPWLQPRNACLWVYCAVVAAGLWSTVGQVRAGGSTYAEPLTISAVVFALYAVLFWWFTTRIDRYSRQPLDLRIAAFMWGGFGATWTMAVHANSAMIGLYGKLVSPEFGIAFGAGLTAPFVEETAKGAGVLLLLFIAPRVLRTAFDGFVIGAFVGLGFEVIEDILYALNSTADGFGADPIGSTLHMLALRLGTGFTSHILYSAIFGAGIVYLVGTRAEKRRVGRGLLLCALAMLFHGVWDSAAGIGDGNGAIVILVLVGSVIVALATVVWVFHLTVGVERVAMRALMEPEVAAGRLNDEELDALAGAWKQRRRYRRGGGIGDRRRRGHRLEAAHDLAGEIGRARGAETERVRHARAELARFAAPDGRELERSRG
ncbi:PrsW family intramembrane metalloprotease [Nocardioides sp. BGMRC 2183]|nr:PrsW family intramembrane metalloprotease [Nocardioides sp. BGMRC 2183]